MLILCRTEVGNKMLVIRELLLLKSKYKRLLEWSVPYPHRRGNTGKMLLPARTTGQVLDVARPFSLSRQGETPRHVRVEVIDTVVHNWMVPSPKESGMPAWAWFGQRKGEVRRYEGRWSLQWRQMT